MAPPLDIKIIGAGIAGLATALALSQLDEQHQITILEAAPALSELGAGIQLAPNATRLLYRWGLRDAFRAVVNEPAVMSIHRYADDRGIGEIAHKPHSELLYGFPHWQCFRPDLQRLLAAACEREAAGEHARPLRICFGAAVVALDPAAGTLTLADGRELSADLVVGADGIRSRMRGFVPSLRDFHARATAEYCFRAVVPREKMLLHPQTAELMAAASLSMIWCGPGVSMLGYPVAGGQLYNVVVTIPKPADADAVGRWSEPGDIREAAEELRPFCERARRVWSLVESCNKWTIGDLPALPTFVSESGKFVLVGDAAHAILPHSGQGGAMALEDAASLAAVVSALPDAAALPRFIHAWSSLRQERLANLRRMAQGNAHFLSTPDGPEQEKRDQLWAAMTQQWKKELQELGEDGLRKMAKVEPDSGVEDMRTPEGRMYIYGYDATAETLKRLEQEGLVQ